MDDHEVAVSSNGKHIYINLMQPPASTTIARNPNLLSHIKAILADTAIEGQQLTLECDMRKPVGYTDAVLVKDKDVIFYARQGKATSFTKFVKNRKTDATSIVSMRLVKRDDTNYSVQNVWIGQLPVPAPDSEDATAASREYWSTHAVVYNGQPLVASSVTKDCPY